MEANQKTNFNNFPTRNNPIQLLPSIPNIQNIKLKSKGSLKNTLKKNEKQNESLKQQIDRSEK